MKYTTDDKVWVSYSEKVISDDPNNVAWYYGPAEIDEVVPIEDAGMHYKIRACTSLHNGQEVKGKSLDFLIPSTSINSR